MTSTAFDTGRTTTTRQRVGLVLCGLFCLVNLPSAFLPVSGEDSPPLAILVADSVLALVGLVAVVAAWRGSALALRVAAGSIILITLTALPAFFVDVPAAVRAVVAVSVLLTLASVVLMLSGARPASRAD